MWGSSGAFSPQAQPPANKYYGCSKLSQPNRIGTPALSYHSQGFLGKENYLFVVKICPWKYTPPLKSAPNAINSERNNKKRKLEAVEEDYAGLEKLIRIHKVPEATIKL